MLTKSVVGLIKSEMAEKYAPTYQCILKQITGGNLIHADETKGVVLGGGHYVWVFENMTTVAYVYSESRESAILENLLDGFKGVLVSGQVPAQGRHTFVRIAWAETILMNTIKALVVEDSPVVRESLIAALEELAPIEVIGAVNDERSAVQWMKAHALECDIVITDICLKDGSGLGVLRAGRQLGTSTSAPG